MKFLPNLRSLNPIRQYKRAKWKEGLLHEHREKYDAKANASTKLPDSEYIDVCCLWAAEFYTPAHMESLDYNLRRLFRRNQHHTGTGIDPVAWLSTQRFRPYGGSSMNMGYLRPASARPSPGSYSTTANLPDSIESAHVDLFCLTPSIICITVCFVFDKELSPSFDRALRKDRETFLADHERFIQYHDPRTQKSDAIKQIRISLCERAETWFARNLPGLFSSGLLGSHLPTCEFITLREAVPVPDIKEDSVSGLGFLHSLGLVNDTSAWRCVAIPGLKFTAIGEHQEDLRYHTTLAVREKDFDVALREFSHSEPRYARISYVDRMLPALLSNWAIQPMLAGYTQHVNEIRNSEMIRAGKTRKAVQVLQNLNSHVSFCADISAVTSDLLRFGQQDLVLHCMEPFEPCSDFPKDMRLSQVLDHEIRHYAKWLQATDKSIRDYLTQYGSILAATRTLFHTRVITGLTVVITVLTGLAVGVSFRQEIAAWWQRLPW